MWIRICILPGILYLFILQLNKKANRKSSVHKTFSVHSSHLCETVSHAFQRDNSQTRGREKSWCKQKNDGWGSQFLKAQNTITYNDFSSRPSVSSSENQVSANFRRGAVQRNWVILRSLQWWARGARMSQHQDSYQHPVKMPRSADFFLSLVLKLVWQESFLHLVCCLITVGENKDTDIVNKPEILHKNDSASMNSTAFLRYLFFLRRTFLVSKFM